MYYNRIYITRDGTAATRDPRMALHTAQHHIMPNQSLKREYERKQGNIGTCNYLPVHIASKKPRRGVTLKNLA